jgi:hypothetical protein
MHVHAAWLRLAVTSALLAISGVLTVTASAQRWWPACRIGAFDSGGCPELQDHAYDYIAPWDPWVPIGNAAEVHGAGMLLLAAAVLLLPRVLAGHRPGRMLTLAAIVVAAGVAVMGLSTLLSGLEGEVVSLPSMWLPAILWMIGLPALLIASAARITPAPPRASVARWAVVMCLIVATVPPVTEYMVAPAIFGYMSYDTTPWAESVDGVLLIGASVFLLLTLHRTPAPDADTVDTADRLTTATVTDAP